MSRTAMEKGSFPQLWSPEGVKSHPYSWIFITCILGVLVGLGITVDVTLVAGGLIGGMVVILSFRYPSLILSSLLSVMLFRRFQILGFSVMGVSLSLAKLAALTTILVFVSHALLKKRQILVVDQISGGLLAIVLSFAVSSLASEYPAGTVARTTSIVLLATLCYFSYRFVTRAQAQMVMKVLPLALGLLTAISLWDTAQGGILSGAVEVSERGEFVRGGGTFIDPNFWASVNLFFIPLVLLHAKEAKRWWVKVYDVAVIAGMCLNIGFSFSRAGFLTLVLLFLLILWTQRKSPALVVTLIVVAAVGLLTVVPLEVLGDRMDRLQAYEVGFDRRSSVSARYHVMVGGVSAFLKFPVFGVGPDQYARYVSYGGLADFGKHSHNIYIQILAELGLVGTFSFLFLVHGVYVRARGLSRVVTGWDRSFLEALGLSFFAYLTMAFTLNLLYMSFVWFILGIGLSMTRWERPPEEERLRPGGTSSPPSVPRALLPSPS